MPNRKAVQKIKNPYVKVSCQKSRSAVDARQTDGYITKIQVPTRYAEVKYECESCFEVPQTDM